MIRLVVNADDFGFTPDVNAGIIQAHREGILTAATLMAGGAAFADAVRLAREHPALDIGCHLVLVGEPGYPATVARLLLQRDLPMERLLRAQIRTILTAGLQPTHLDTHKHTHLSPRVLDVVLRLAREFEIPWVRKPFDYSSHTAVPWSKRAVSTAIGLTRPRFERLLRQASLRSTDHFLGFQVTGSLDTPTLVQMIRSLPEGVTELMCHPGLLGSGLGAARTRLKQSRVVELEALTSPDVHRAVQERHVVLVNYRDLA